MRHLLKGDGGMAGALAYNGLNLQGLGLLMLLAVLVELLWRARLTRRGYDGAGAATSLAVALGNLVVGAVTAGGLAGVFALVWTLAPVRWPLADWRTWAAGFLAVELAYYAFHRWSHEIRWLWATHVVHHSPEELTFLSAVRLGWTNILSGGWAVYLPLVLIGFDPRLVLTLLAFNLHYQFFLHTEMVGRLGPLEWVFNTPSHHRVHHACNSPYLDRNYGGVLIIFDRLFGTFAEARPEEPLRYGLVHPVGSYNPLVVALGEWRRLFADLFAARSFRDALRAAFGRPA
jgi:sterol desaturase/sphingolipid hydroxylase (fatty acid hydroxylase superfamily)